PVTGHVPEQFAFPPRAVVGGVGGMHRTTIPTAPVDEHHDPVPYEGHVRTPAGHAFQGKIDPVTQPFPVQNAAQPHLRAGVLALLPCHPPRGRPRHALGGHRHRPPHAFHVHPPRTHPVRTLRLPPQVAVSRLRLGRTAVEGHS